ncbi:MAG: IcmH [uncultured bacterium]|nr:MAG: IcmH [uncultured bacterium]
MNLSGNLFSPTLNVIETNEMVPSPVPSGFYRSRIYTSNVSINPLIVACDPILTLSAALKTIEYPSDRNKFLEDLAHEIRAFEHRAKIANYPDNVIADARYALCCLLDETIALTSEWGKDNGWLQGNLLNVFYNESYGGEHFFAIVDRALEDMPANLHLIELLYLCLSFGFAGKYYNTEYGDRELAFVTNKLYQIINQYRHINRRDLFLCKSKPWLQQHKNHDPSFTPQAKGTKLFGVSIVVALGISALIYFGVYLKLHAISKPLYPLIEQGIYSKYQGGN